MNKEQNNIIYTAKDIEQYFAGNLSPARMHEMEKAALDDPFLADAMEGYEIMQGKEWKTHLSDLHQQLEDRSSMARVIPMQQSSTRKWWKIAAAIFIIGAGTALTLVFTKDKSSVKEEPQVVQTTTPGQDTASIQPITSSTVSTGKEKATEPTIVKSTSGKTEQPAKDIVAINNDQRVKNNNDAIIKPVNPPAGPGGQTTSITRGEIAVVNDSVNSKAVVTSPPVPLTRNSVTTVDKDIDGRVAKTANDDAFKKKPDQNVSGFVKTQPLNRSFAAQVVGPDNTPLPFSNVSIKSENFGTYADVKGNFRLVSSDSILIVEVKSVGYLPRVYMLHSAQGVGGNQPQNKIVLAEDEIAYQEKAVVKNKVPGTNISRRATLVKDSVVNVEPADGWDNYNTYVANNIELPDEVLKNNLHGEISVSFDVTADGSITNIKIDPSLCNNCEEITKRLIEQGPQWKVKKGKKASARVRVQF